MKLPGFYPQIAQMDADFLFPFPWNSTGLSAGNRVESEAVGIGAKI